MIKSLTIFILISIGLYSCVKHDKKSIAKDPVEIVEVESTTIPDTVTEPLIIDPATHIHTETRYNDSVGKSVFIQNSYPRGGGSIDNSGIPGYYDQYEKHHGYAIFWTRVVNESNATMDLSISFPADSFNIFPEPDSYLKLFLPPDTMTLAKRSMYNYGIRGLRSFLDSGFYKQSTFQRTIEPNGECLLYVVPYPILVEALPERGSLQKNTSSFIKSG
ncbi:MAG: hypothetical protein KJO29_13015 [Bacteroidia bacterium]|nr:hypothetical protein [Bacteroidia bacterium]